MFNDSKTEESTIPYFVSNVSCKTICYFLNQFIQYVSQSPLPSSNDLNYSQANFPLVSIINLTVITI